MNQDKKKDDINVDLTTYQELYELAQRKVLRQLIQFSDFDPYKIYPRLIYIDLYEKEKIQIIVNYFDDLKRNDELKSKEISEKKDIDNEIDSNTLERVKSILNEVKLIGNIDEIAKLLKTSPGNYVQGLRILCEHEEGWHKSNCFLPLNEVAQNFCPFLIRILNLMKK
jgi:hypothetical protein